MKRSHDTLFLDSSVLMPALGEKWSYNNHLLSAEQKIRKMNSDKKYSSDYAELARLALKNQRDLEHSSNGSSVSVTTDTEGDLVNSVAQTKGKTTRPVTASERQARKRKMDAIYARQRRKREKGEEEHLQKKFSDLRQVNMKLEEESKRLQMIATEAYAKIALIEGSSRLVESSHGQNATTSLPLQTDRNQIVVPSLQGNGWNTDFSCQAGKDMTCRQMQNQCSSFGVAPQLQAHHPTMTEQYNQTSMLEHQNGNNQFQPKDIPQISEQQELNTSCLESMIQELQRLQNLQQSPSNNSTQEGFLQHIASPTNQNYDNMGHNCDLNPPRQFQQGFQNQGNNDQSQWNVMPGASHVHDMLNQGQGFIQDYRNTNFNSMQNIQPNVPQPDNEALLRILQNSFLS